MMAVFLESAADAPGPARAAAGEGRAVDLRAEAHRRLERRATNCTYRKREEIGPAWVLSSLEGLFVSAAYAKPKGEARRGTTPRSSNFAKRTRVSLQTRSAYEFEHVQQRAESQLQRHSSASEGL